MGGQFFDLSIAMAFAVAHKYISIVITVRLIERSSATFNFFTRIEHHRHIVYICIQLTYGIQIKWLLAVSVLFVRLFGFCLIVCLQNGSIIFHSHRGEIIAIA